MNESTAEQKTFVINTMTAEKYEDLSSKGMIKADELNIVDDDDQNRTVIPSYDMLKKLSVDQTQTVGAIVSGLWNALSGKAYTVDGEGLSVLKTASIMTCRDLAESILSVMSFVSCWWTTYETNHAADKA